MGNEDKRAFEQYAEAHGVHYHKQAAQLVDYESGASMQEMLSDVLAAYPTLKEAVEVRHVGNPTNHGAEPQHITKRTASTALSNAALEAKKAGTVAARVAYAQQKRNQNQQRGL